MAAKYCHPEFGCDCDIEIRRLEDHVVSLEAEVKMLRLRLEVNTNIAVALMEHDEREQAALPPEDRKQFSSIWRS